MKKSSPFGILVLFIAAFIWGSSFVAQSIGMETIEAFTYNGIRTLMGAAVLLPIVLFNGIKEKRTLSPEKRGEKKKQLKNEWKCGIIVGLALCVASNSQQFAFNYSTPGKIAFITALYMLFVPIIGIFLGKKIPKIIWLCALMGAAGLYFLSFSHGEPSGINFGDVLSLICAVFYAIHIILIDRFAPDIDSTKLSLMQFIVSGTISVVLMFIFESPSITAIKSAIWPLLYSGILSCGIAFTFQVIGQKHTEPTLASLIMCMESVFGVLSAAVILHQIPTYREILGCALMFAAIIAAQFSDRINLRRKQAP